MAAQLGGYFAVSYVAEHVFTDALEAIWRTQWEQSVGPAQWSADTPLGHLDATGVFSLNKPGMRFDGSSNRVAVHLTGGGRFDVTLAGVALGGVFVEVDAEAALPVTVTQEEVFTKAVVDMSAFALDLPHVRLTWFDGPLIEDGGAAVTSDAARAALAAELRSRAARFMTFRLPTDRLWLAELTLMTKGNPGSVIITPLIKLGAVRILNGWFALGIDATSSVGETHGDATVIGFPPDPPPPGPAPLVQAGPGDASVRLLVEPATLIAYLTANARLALTMAAAKDHDKHPNIDALRVVIEDDSVVISDVGTVNAPDPFPGQMPFTANVRIRPFIPEHTCTVYASIKPDVRVDTPLFLQILGMIIDLFGGDSFAALRRANKSEMAILFGVKFTGPVPELSGVDARIEGRQLVIRPDLVGLYGEAAVTTTFSGPSADLTPDVFNSVPIRDRFLRLQHANRRMTVDPTFRIRYSVRRGSNGTEVASGTVWSGTGKPFSTAVDLWDPANVQETTYAAELFAERPPGTVVAHVVQTFFVLDPFDRSRPFVRWQKKHFFTGSDVPINIASAIHSTAIPGRCQFSDFRDSRFGTPYSYQGIDTLPVTEEDGLSTRLCQYCFPNGPPDDK